MKKLLEKGSNAYKAKVKEHKTTNRALQEKANSYDNLKAENDALLKKQTR